jgi:hypothetical protein
MLSAVPLLLEERSQPRPCSGHAQQHNPACLLLLLQGIAPLGSGWRVAAVKEATSHSSACARPQLLLVLLVLAAAALARPLLVCLLHQPLPVTPHPDLLLPELLLLLPASLAQPHQPPLAAPRALRLLPL